MAEENGVCPKCLGAGFIGENWKDHRDTIRQAIQEGVRREMKEKQAEFLKAQDQLIQDRVEELTQKRIEALERFEKDAYRELLAHHSSLHEIEIALIREALVMEGGNVTKAARRLGIGRATMYRKMDEIKARKGSV